MHASPKRNLEQPPPPGSAGERATMGLETHLKFRYIPRCLGIVWPVGETIPASPKDLREGRISTLTRDAIVTWCAILASPPEISPLCESRLRGQGRSPYVLSLFLYLWLFFILLFVIGQCLSSSWQTQALILHIVLLVCILSIVTIFVTSRALYESLCCNAILAPFLWPYNLE